MTVGALASRLQIPGGLPSGSPGPVRIQSQPSEGAGLGRAQDGPAFGETLADAIDRVDGAQKAADAQVESFVAGETENVHDVMIALNEAELHFKLLTEVRNKLLEGYQELMRMQV